jgi:glycosyltransferase involved in cell wall biosynthesis
MRVVVSCAGGFHSPYLSSQLHRHGALRTLITPYPKNYFRRRFQSPLGDREIDSTRLMLVDRGLSRVFGGSRDRDWALSNLHDIYASKRIREDVEIVAGWSGQCLRTLRAANRRGLISIVVRGSAHMLDQTEIVGGEHERLGLPFFQDPRVIDRELEEYAEATYVQTISSFARDTFIARGIPPERVLMQPLGVNLERFQPVPRTDDTFRIVYVGAASVRKGTHILLDAFAQLARPDAELVLIGNITQELAERVARAPKNVRAIGHVPEAELYKHYSQGSVFVLPSLEDGFGQVAAQAMACGLPLVCTTNTGGPDLIGPDRDAGIVVPIRDVDALRDAFARLYDDRESCLKMGQRARERVSRGFTWDDYGDGIFAHYERILAARTSSTAR